MDKESCKRIICEHLLSTGREGMPKMIEWLEHNGYFESPASTKYHGSHAGGLAYHSLAVYVQYKKLMIMNKRKEIKELTFRNSLKIVCMLHDVCKVGAYVVNGDVINWNTNHPKGHSELSLAIIEKFLKLTSQERSMIKYHMGYYGCFEFDAKKGEYSLKELCQAQNDVYVKLMYFADDISSQLIG